MLPEHRYLYGIYVECSKPSILGRGRSLAEHGTIGAGPGHSPSLRGWVGWVAVGRLGVTRAAVSGRRGWVVSIVGRGWREAVVGVGHGGDGGAAGLVDQGPPSVGVFTDDDDDDSDDDSEYDDPGNHPSNQRPRR